MVKQIIGFNSLLLRATTHEVALFDNTLEAVVQDLVETCQFHGGVGLAAPQIGCSLRVFAVCEPRMPVKVFINPQIEYLGEEVDSEEGCLSISGVRAKRKRNSIVKVAFQTTSGDTVERVYEGLTAIIIQHEYDHLKGELFIDKLDDFICPVCKKIHMNLKSRICSVECFMFLKGKRKK